MSLGDWPSDDIEAFLQRHEQKELLRFVAVGSVDDGKSTLIGRLLHDTQGIYEDQLSAVKRASKQGGAEIDFSLFTDGLRAEREQGITIDVAYRYFSTEKRKFIIADTPGHVQYTRNMTTGASTADLAIILIDARLGVLQQSRRHAYIASLLGIQQLTVCVNKMDLVGFEPAVFERIRAELESFAEVLRFGNVTFIPISALTGDNVVQRSERAPWYEGPTLLEHLECVPVPHAEPDDAFRYPVQSVLRPTLDYRAFAGQIAAGTVAKGDEILVLPAGTKSRVVAIDTFEGEVEVAFSPMSVALRLEDEIDISRGDMLVHSARSPRVASRFGAMLVWMSERPLDTQRSYFVKHAGRYVRAEIERVEHVIELSTLQPTPAKNLELNDIGRVTVSAHQPLYFDAYSKSRATGAFVVIDALSNNTVAAGMMLEGEPSARVSGFALAQGLPRSEVTAADRVERMQQRGAVVFLTGLPASGKSSVAYALERRLFDRGNVAVVVDPDDGVTREPGKGGATLLHAPELARRFADSGLLCIFAFESALDSDRQAVRAAVGPERFIEVYVSTPLEVCRQRDRRGTYGRVHGAPPYETPGQPDVTLSSEIVGTGEIADTIVELLLLRGFV